MKRTVHAVGTISLVLLKPHFAHPTCVIEARSSLTGGCTNTMLSVPFEVSAPAIEAFRARVAAEEEHRGIVLDHLRAFADFLEGATVQAVFSQNSPRDAVRRVQRRLSDRGIPQGDWEEIVYVAPAEWTQALAETLNLSTPYEYTLMRAIVQIAGIDDAVMHVRNLAPAYDGGPRRFQDCTEAFAAVLAKRGETERFYICLATALCAKGEVTILDRSAAFRAPATVAEDAEGPVTVATTPADSQYVH